ncbi:MAG: hypothetical protein M1834_006494 [Cirrosporium novae-zelandiae]|nr:MAG: hypothetical protein M1834_006494 [Cirrosporium novae-zelandiae]
MDEEKANDSENQTSRSPRFSEPEETIVSGSDIEDASTPDLSMEHRDYLMKRHGTLDLDPMPSADPADPYNWPAWKKNINLLLVAFHGMIATFIASGIIPAYEDIATAFGGSLTKASYLTSAQIMMLGVAPLLWKPISNRFGRRPIWLISTFCSAICNIGCAKCPGYGSMMITRLLVAFFISPPLAIGTGVVAEMFFKKERGQKMGIWAPETLYIRSHKCEISPERSAFSRKYLNFGRIDYTPLRGRDFYGPVFLSRYLSALIPAISYAIVFGFTCVMLTVEIPQLYTPKFGFNAQQIGLQFIAMIIGTIIGEQFSGPLSDFLMNRQAKKLGYRPAPEYRLWASYLGFLSVIVGLIVFGVKLDQLPLMEYNVSPTIGIGICAFGNQIVTTVLITYVVDCHQDSAASIGPFWFPDMFDTLGVAPSAGLCCGIIAVVSILPIAFLQLNGVTLRKKYSI